MIFKILFIFLFTNTNEKDVTIENLFGNWERVCIESDALGFQISNCNYNDIKINFSEWNYIEMIYNNGDRKFYDFILDGNKLSIFYNKYHSIINNIEIRGDTLIIESNEIYNELIAKKFYNQSQVNKNYQGIINTGRGPNSTYKKIFDSISKKIKKKERKKIADKLSKSIIKTLKSNQNLYPQRISKNLSNKIKVPVIKDAIPFKNTSLTNVKKVSYKNADDRLSVNYNRVYFVKKN